MIKDSLDHVQININVIFFERIPNKEKLVFIFWPTCLEYIRLEST